MSLFASHGEVFNPSFGMKCDLEAFQSNVLRLRLTHEGTQDIRPFKECMLVRFTKWAEYFKKEVLKDYKNATIMKDVCHKNKSKKCVICNKGRMTGLEQVFVPFFSRHYKSYEQRLFWQLFR